MARHAHRIQWPEAPYPDEPRNLAALPPRPEGRWLRVLRISGASPGPMEDHRTHGPEQEDTRVAKDGIENADGRDRTNVSEKKTDAVGLKGIPDRLLANARREIKRPAKRGTDEFHSREESHVGGDRVGEGEHG